MNTKKKRGRPVGYRKDNAASVAIPSVRVTPNQLTAYKAASKRSGQTFSAWVRSALDRVATQRENGR